MLFIKQKPDAQNPSWNSHVQVLGYGAEGIFPGKQEKELSGICEPGQWPHQPPPSDRQPAPEG